MGKLIYTPFGVLLFFLRCIIAFSFTVFWFIPTIRLNLHEDGWLTFWYLLGMILLLTFKIKFRGSKK
jgi:hypothetical protein